MQIQRSHVTSGMTHPHLPLQLTPFSFTLTARKINSDAPTSLLERHTRQLFSPLLFSTVSQGTARIPTHFKCKIRKDVQSRCKLYRTMH